MDLLVCFWKAVLAFWAGTFRNALSSYMPGSWMPNSFRLFWKSLQESRKLLLEFQSKITNKHIPIKMKWEL